MDMRRLDKDTCVMRAASLLSLFSCLTVASRVEPGKRLIKTEFEVLELNDDEVQDLIVRNAPFMDISYGPELQKSDSLPKAKLPTKLREHRASTIRTLIDDIDKELMKKHSNKLASSRSKATTGREPTEWLFRMIRHLTKNSPMRVTTQRIIHKGRPQFSISCRIESPDKNMSLDKMDRVILSAPINGGASVVAQLEVLRLVASTAVQITRPIEFLFFSAEKAGLLGSQSVIRHYQKKNISAAVLHTDIDSHTASGAEAAIGLIRDNTDRRMNRLLQILIGSYSTLPVRNIKCGYACSDYYSWHVAGYPVAGLSSGTMTKRRSHTLAKTVNFDYVKEFVNIALSYALHMTDPEVNYN
ncbi:Peptide hydrolase [Paramicrosporidium saccamoebae]|uniref:Peptide hydrolase n=1 Tax=Paramicrosporidium saccamoebae TaxID=1246581 RepID=A0A2H9TJW5_9FUNG|nr:Peptide hydrolase [Paramicrosporidium saccamoebae]